MGDDTTGEGAAGSTAPVGALAEHATPLGTTEPSGPFPDTDGLDALLGGAQVVGLGEATHGTREFFRLKHRLIRYLVLEHDLRVVAIEANVPETLAIDEYVVHGRGDPSAALDGIYFWTWNVAAVLDLIEWLRGFNEGRPVEDRVRFYGLDVQYTTGAVEHLRGYFETVGEAVPEEIAAGVETVDDSGRNPDRDENPEERLAAGKQVATALRDHLDTHRTTYVERAGERAWWLARWQAAVIEQATAYRKHRVDQTDGDTAAMEQLLERRDRAMADNVDRVREFEGGPVAVWAHDAHVNRSRHVVRGTDATSKPTGGYLADRHDTGYVAVGFSFAHGSFQALGETAEGGYERRAHAVDGPPSGSIEARLDALGESPVLLDLRRAAEDSRLTDWLDRPQGTFSAGATYNPDRPAQYVTEFVPGEAFDAICHVTETSRARPLGDDT